MVTSKGWDWQAVEKSIWLDPCEESYYYANKWKKAGCKSVLDLGCGLGRHAILFAKNGFKVTAVDIAREGVDYLKSWQKEEGVDILCKVCDMNELPFATDAFDCVWSYLVISHTDTEGIKKILQEIKRVLKPEGQFFLTLCSKDTWSFKEADFPRVDENTILKTEPPAEVGVPHFYVDLDDIPPLFADFEITRIRHVDNCYFNGRKQNNKHYFVEGQLHKKAYTPDYTHIIGTSVSGTIDRPLGFAHPRHPEIIYAVNYGYVNGVFAGDGAEQDVYVFGTSEPIHEFTGKVIGVYHRFNDNEDKWIVALDDKEYSDEEILAKIDFQEKFFDGVLYRG